MGQSRSDQEWPRPTTTRHCWIKSTDGLQPPTQGLVLQWTRHSYRWSALVVYVDDGRIVQEWMPYPNLGDEALGAGGVTQNYFRGTAFE